MSYKLVNNSLAKIPNPDFQVGLNMLCNIKYLKLSNVGAVGEQV